MSLAEEHSSLDANEIKDTAPSGFDPIVDFVSGEEHQRPVLGPAAPNVVAVGK